jgi:hypothetical protein
MPRVGCDWWIYICYQARFSAIEGRLYLHKVWYSEMWIFCKASFFQYMHQNFLWWTKRFFTWVYPKGTVATPTKKTETIKPLNITLVMTATQVGRTIFLFHRYHDRKFESWGTKWYSTLQIMVNDDRTEQQGSTFWKILISRRVSLAIHMAVSIQYAWQIDENRQKATLTQNLAFI